MVLLVSVVELVGFAYVVWFVVAFADNLAFGTLAPVFFGLQVLV